MVSNWFWFYDTQLKTALYQKRKAVFDHISKHRERVANTTHTGVFLPKSSRCLEMFCETLSCVFDISFLKLMNNSSSLNRGNHDRDGVWICDLDFFLHLLLNVSFD